MQKIIIITTKKDDILKYQLCRELFNKYEMEVGIPFSTIEEPGYQYIEFQEVQRAYKNNALFCCSTNKDNVTIGMTMDEYYNKDIFCISIPELLNISDEKFSNILIIWLDNIKDDSIQYEDINKVNRLVDFLEHNDYLYFYNNGIDEILEVFDKYINSSFEDRKKILEENS